MSPLADLQEFSPFPGSHARADVPLQKIDGEGQTQQAVADAIGWALSKLKMYAALRSICDEAWDIIKVATNSGYATDSKDDDATEIVANATFTEGLLRNILDLEPAQQLDLCRMLAKGKGRLRAV